MCKWVGVGKKSQDDGQKVQQMAPYIILCESNYSWNCSNHQIKITSLITGDLNK